jgi:hypothetical protein
MIRHLLSSPLSPVFTGSQDEGSCARSSAAQGRARPIPGWGQPLTQRDAEGRCRVLCSCLLPSGKFLSLGMGCLALQVVFADGWPFFWAPQQQGQLCREDFLGSIVCCWGCYGDTSWVATQGGGPYPSLGGLTCPLVPGCLSGEVGGG